MYNLQDKVVFIHIPKTAGTSVNEALYQSARRANRWKRRANRITRRVMGRDAFGVSDYQTICDHATARDYLDHLGPAYWSTCRFAFVRNPFDRYVSQFYYIQQNPSHPEHERLRSHTFRDYVVRTCGNHRPVTQSSYLLDKDGNSLVSHIGRVETIQEDFANICADAGLDLSLPHRNKTSRKKYVENYDAETAGLVASAFWQDFDLLGYSRDPQCSDFEPVSLRAPCPHGEATGPLVGHQGMAGAT